MQKPISDWEAARREAERRRDGNSTALMPRRPAQRPARPIAPAQVVPEPEPAKPAEKRLREAAKAVIAAWDSGDLADAVRGLDIVLSGGAGTIGQKGLKNLYHPASYRAAYEVTLSGDDLRRLQLLANAVSMNGPVGTTAYIINPKEMAWAQSRLRKIREAK
jgi:hypothetical protein